MTTQGRRHWALLILLAAGLGLRVVTQLAYRAALLCIDSPKYFSAGLEKYDPQGYRDLVVRPLKWVGNLALVAAFQHLLGLAMAVALYLLLLRRGVPRWAATLAAAPILLDAYQLQMEQTIMPDVTFEALIVTGSSSCSGRRGRGCTPWRWPASCSGSRSFRPGSGRLPAGRGAQRARPIRQ